MRSRQPVVCWSVSAFRLALVGLVLGGFAATASADVLNAANTPLALSRLAAAAIAKQQQPPAGMELARTVEYTTASGQTISIRLFANSLEQRKQMETIAQRLERLQQQRMQMSEDGSCDPEDGSNCGPDEDGGWSAPAVEISLADMIGAACEAVSATAQKVGAASVWLDATNALCSSFTIVDFASKVLDAAQNWAYQSFIASVLRTRPGEAINIFSLIDMGHLPIY